MSAQSGGCFDQALDGGSEETAHRADFVLKVGKRWAILGAMGLEAFLREAL